MELGQRLRQARLEAGLSQRQLCAQVITRNMLSQIENGSARPSMDTLRYLAERLGKPVSWFLEEAGGGSENQRLMLRLHQADSPQQILTLLKEYRSPDPVFDRERWLIEALACMEAGEQALEEGRGGYARTLLEQAAQAGSQTPYYTPELEGRRAVLCHRAGMDPGSLLRSVPELDDLLFLQAQAALEAEDPQRCAALLEAARKRDGRWQLLRGQAAFAQKEYQRAADYFQAGEATDPVLACTCLERCYQAMEDYRMAYHYACKLREL